MKQVIGGLPATVFPIKIGAISLMLWLPDNAEEYILNVTEEKFGEDERLPYWAILWPASIALAEHLEELDIAKSTTCIELGAGLALPSLIAAKKGANVLATDWFLEATEYAKVNARANACELDAKILDWRQTPAGMKFDLVLGADILYEKRNHSPVLEALENLLSLDGTAFVSDPQRQRMSEFVDEAKLAGWHLRPHLRHVNWQGISTEVTVWEVSRKAFA